MRPRLFLKTYIAVFISLAFVFRLLMVNMSLLASPSIPQGKHLATTYFAQLNKKRKRDMGEVDNSNLKTYSPMDVCEEDTDNEDDLVKASLPPMPSDISTSLKRLVFDPKPTLPFGLIKCELYPKKYLSLSILRI